RAPGARPEWRRRLVDRAMTLLCGACVLVALLPLASLLWLVVSRGVRALSWELLTRLPLPMGEGRGGVGDGARGRSLCVCLGVPVWRTSLRVVLRTALGGVLGAALLGISPAAGETAPLLFTALNNQYWNLRPDQPTASLTVQIYNYAVSPYEDWHQKAWGAA